MAVVRAYAAYDSRNFDFYGFFDRSPKFVDQTPTSFKIELDNTTTTYLKIQGFGFEYGPGNIPIGGTTTAAQSYENNQLVSEISGLLITQEQAQAYISSNDPEAVKRDIFKGNDVFVGSSFDDYIEGFAGNDRLTGGGGADTLYGGAGDDTYYVETNADRVRESVGAGKDTVLAAAEFGLADGQAVEILRTQDDTGTKAIELRGNGFAQTLIGNAGSNVLNGRAGADTMIGLGGNDIYDVDNAGDTVTEAAGKGTDLVRTTLNTYTLSANVEQVVFAGTGAFTATGNASDNRFTGGAGDDRFFTDGQGSDIFGGGAGSDAVYYTKAAGGAAINFATGINGGAASGDIYGSIEKFFGSNAAGDAMTAGTGRSVFSGQGGNDKLTGGSNIDQLLGGADNDTLKGGAAVDQLSGGLGNDVMDGGADRDLFLFVEPKFEADTIQNFEDGLDRLKVFSAVADTLADFTIAGNGTSHVVLSLKADPTNTITLDGKGGADLVVTAADVLFY